MKIFGKTHGFSNLIETGLLLGQLLLLTMLAIRIELNSALPANRSEVQTRIYFNVQTRTAISTYAHGSHVPLVFRATEAIIQGCSSAYSYAFRYCAGDSRCHFEKNTLANENMLTFKIQSSLGFTSGLTLTVLDLHVRVYICIEHILAA